MIKAFAKRFDFNDVRTSQPRTVVRARQLQMPRGMVIYKICILTIQRGALALLVSNYRAMRRPLHRGASDKHRLHVLFCACPKQLNLLMTAEGAREKNVLLL